MRLPGIRSRATEKGADGPDPDALPDRSGSAVDPSVAIPIPSERSRAEVQAELDRFPDWFYDFQFANGAETAVKGDATRGIRTTKPGLILPRLDETFRDRWDKVECVDVACHQGWFATQVALRGARHVHGFDVRPEHVERAALISGLAGLTNTSFEQRNLWDVDPERRYDLTLFLGLLYHLDNPVGALKLARALTKELCVIESQVARAAPELEYIWGGDTSLRTGYPIAVGRVGPRHVAEDTQMTLVPTLKALEYMLHTVGFEQVEVATPPPSAYEQYADYDRVVVFAA